MEAYKLIYGIYRETNYSTHTFLSTRVATHENPEQRSFPSWNEPEMMLGDDCVLKKRWFCANECNNGITNQLAQQANVFQLRQESRTMSFVFHEVFKVTTHVCKGCP